MAGNGGRIAGILSIVLAALAAVAGILNHASRHPRRELAFFIVGGVLLILGIVLIAAAGRKVQQIPGK
ncbi:MAG: hypothetical protein ABSG21_02570 [Spirochaetia bacterium]|jgi:glucose uptake protein GlcU